MELKLTKVCVPFQRLLIFAQKSYITGRQTITATVRLAVECTARDRTQGDFAQRVCSTFLHCYLLESACWTLC